ncbi:MAG TPA: Ig-like domain-containing protein [Chitinophagaceae bacterium]|nr:Ig-like domain-containing protein [Chitinophagaceae bacterium]
MGGAKDTIPPMLAKATPTDSATNVKTNRIVLEFSEYIQMQSGAQQQIIVSPVPEVQPLIEARLKNVTIKLKDSLKPNTTYSINFGDVIQDINESNPIKNFTYVFTTGSVIDTGKLSGRIVLAETGLADSTIFAILQPEISDTAVRTKKPMYSARLNKEGFFNFRFIAPGTYNVFALKDLDGSLKYDQVTELFGFLDTPVHITSATPPVKINAFQEEKEKPRAVSTTTTGKPAANKDDRRLRYSTNTEMGSLDYLGDLKLSFDKKPVKFDSTKIYLATDSGIKLPSVLSLDSNVLTISHKWTPATKYRLYVEKGLAEDTLGNSVLRSDTLKITTKRAEDYGSLSIRFQELDTSAHPVLLFYANDKLKFSKAITFNRLDIAQMLPGEYELRVLFDRNSNGIWDTGNYGKRLQPEIIKTRKQKLNIRPNWDNEVDINIRQVQNQD